jgi:hypothetical protein
MLPTVANLELANNDRRNRASAELLTRGAKLDVGMRPAGGVEHPRNR